MVSDAVAIQTSLASEDFESAQTLAADYCAQIARDLSSISTFEIRRAVALQALENYRSWLHLARAISSHINARLFFANAESGYQSQLQQPSNVTVLL